MGEGRRGKNQEQKKAKNGRMERKYRMPLWMLFDIVQNSRLKVLPITATFETEHEEYVAIYRFGGYLRT